MTVSATVQQSDTVSLSNRPLYVIGGQQRSSRTLSEGNGNWEGYKQGLLLRVYPSGKQGDVCMSYVSPPDARGEEDPMLFKSATLEGDVLYVSTTTEVMTLRLPDCAMEQYLSLPIFNDVHHVRPTGTGTLLVANSGLEQVLELTWEGQIVHAWHTLGADAWAHVAPDCDYRKGISTKPHQSHPNYVFMLDDEIWATRFHQYDALCLNRPDRRIELGRERVHDGVVVGDIIYFTAVDGNLIMVNRHTLRIEEVIDLNSMHEPDVRLGWCRGIYMDDPYIWIGFSRIRPTRLRQNVAWVARGFKRDMPTHIGCYDLRRRQCVQEISVEELGLNAVFGIFGAPVSTGE